MLKQNDRLRAIMAVGDLVSDEVVWELLKKPLSKHLEGKESIIVDGFPRTPVQMEMILSYLLGKHISYCVRVVHLTLTEEESRVRLELRAQAEGREDDMDPRAINNRIFKYRENYTKIVEKSINFGVRVHEVNGEKTEERVLNDVIKLI